MLRLGRCNAVTDIGLGRLARSATGLTELDLSGCEGQHVTDVGVGALSALTELKSLGLGHCER